MEIDIFNNWFKLTKDFIILDTIQEISCDTRSFHIICNNVEPNLYLNNLYQEYKTNAFYNTIKLINIYKKKNIPLQYLIDKNKIVEFLLKIKDISGGDINWRFLEADYKNLTGWDIKYIRFIRKNKDSFIVYNNRNIPIDYNKIIEKYIHNPINHINNK